MKKLTIIALIASIIGFIDSIYLTIVKFTQIPLYCTPGLGNCDTVQNSQWSEILGIPIALLGGISYLILIICYLYDQKSTFFSKYNSYIIFGISFFGFIYSLYLTYIELFILHTICQWCVLSAICMTIIFVTTIIRLKINK